MRILSAILFCVSLTSAATAETRAVKQPFYPRAKVNRFKPRQAPGAPIVVNAASYLPGVSPGGLATVFGSNLSTVSSIVVAGTDPLPLQLADVSIFVNNLPAPIYGVAFNGTEDQISFQVPYDAPVGSGAALVHILNNGQEIIAIQTDSFTEDPGIFLYNGNYAVAINAYDNSLVSPANPAFPGDVITLYTTGLGPLNDTSLVDGYGAPSDPLARTVDPFDVLVNGETCSVQFSGLAPGFVGLYQLNLQLPSDLPAGDLTIQIQSQYANSGQALLSVK